MAVEPSHDLIDGSLVEEKADFAGHGEVLHAENVEEVGSVAEPVLVDLSGVHCGGKGWGGLSEDLLIWVGVELEDGLTEAVIV